MGFVYSLLKFTQEFTTRVCMGTVFGCAPVVAPPGAWTQYNSIRSAEQEKDLAAASMTVVVRCNETSESWHLLCRGTEWIGTVGNCSADVTDGGKMVVLYNSQKPMKLCILLVVVNWPYRRGWTRNALF